MPDGRASGSSLVTPAAGGPATIGRRVLLRRAMLTAGAAAVGLGAAACAGSPGAASPQVQSATTTVTFAPWGQWPGIGHDWVQFIRPPLDAFEQANPGLKIQVVSPVSGGNALPQLIAGTAPDVFSEYDILPYMQAAGLVLDLQPLLRRDNVATSLWSPGQMPQFYSGSGLWFLPNYLNVAAVAVNLGDLDELGLAYPSSDWTSDEALKLFQATTFDKGGKHHYGFSPVYRGVPYRSAGPLPNALYALEIFGGSVIDSTRTKCTLDDPKVVQAVEWWLQMFTSRVATGANSPLANPWRATFVENRNNHLLYDAQNWTKQYKWQFMPIPNYPAGPMGWVGSEGYAINPAAKDTEAAWTFLKFLVVETAWQKYGMKVLLKPPSILSLWGQMTATMQAVVPGFAGKGLQWYAQSAAHWARAVPAYRYNPTNAMKVVNGIFQQMLAGKVDPTTGLKSATQQVNAMQVEGAAGPAPATGPQMLSQAQASKQRLDNMFAAGTPVGGG